MTDQQAAETPEIKKQNPLKVTGAENLLSGVRKEKTDLPKSLAAELVIDAFSVAAAALVSFFYRRFLSDAASLASVLVTLSLFALISVFALLITKKFKRRLGVIAFDVIGLLLFFYDFPISILASAALAGCIFLLWGEYSSRARLRNSMEIQFFATTKPYFNKFITAAVLMGVLLYLPYLDKPEGVLSERTFDSFFSASAGAAANFYPDVRTNGTVREFAESVVLSKVKNTPDYKALPSSAKAEQVSLAAGRIIEELSKMIGRDLRPNEPLAAAFYGWFSEAVQGWHTSFGDRFLYAWALAAFIVIRGFGYIFQYILSFIAYLVYEALVGLNVLKIVGESRMKETIIWGT